MKKIIFFSKNMEIGGMEKALVILLNSIASNYDITLILEEKKGPLLNEINKNIKICEYKLSNNKIVIIRKAINYIKRTIWKKKNHNKFDFSCNYATYSVIGSRLAVIASKNNSLYVHSDYYGLFNGDVQRIKDFFTLLRISDFKHVIFVSNESKNKIENIYCNLKNRFLVINNLIDYEKINSLSENVLIEKNIFNGNFINFLFVGRLDNSSKNFPLLIESFYRAIAKNNKIMLYIIGNGHDLILLKRLIIDCKLEKNVILLGEKKNPYPYIKRCDCLVMTSKYEGFPVIYNEALVLNKPFITTINSSDENIKISNYFILSNSNSKDLSEKILNFNKAGQVNYKIDFKSINEIRKEKIIKLI